MNKLEMAQQILEQNNQLLAFITGNDIVDSELQEQLNRPFVPGTQVNSEPVNTPVNVPSERYRLSDLSVHARNKSTGYPIHNSPGRLTIDDIYKRYDLSYTNYYGSLSSMKGKLTANPTDKILQYIVANMSPTDLPRISVALGIMFIQDNMTVIDVPANVPANVPVNTLNGLVNRRENKRDNTPVNKVDLKSVDVGLSTFCRENLQNSDTGRLTGLRLIGTIPLEWYGDKAKHALTISLAKALWNVKSWLRRGAPQKSIVYRFTQFSAERVAIFQLSGKAVKNVRNDDIFAVLRYYSLDNPNGSIELWNDKHNSTVHASAIIRDKRSENITSNDYYAWQVEKGFCSCGSQKGHAVCPIGHLALIQDPDTRTLPVPNNAQNEVKESKRAVYTFNGFAPTDLPALSA